MRPGVTGSATAAVVVGALTICGVGNASTTRTDHPSATTEQNTVQPKPPPHQNPGEVCTWEKPTFDPRVATPEQRRQHGDFPPRPVGNPNGQVAWEHYVTMYLAGEVTLCIGPGVPGPLSSSGPILLGRAQSLHRGP